MADWGVSYHNAYRFETWGEGPRLVGFVYKMSGGGWIATVDGTNVKVVGVGRGPTAEEAVRQARMPEGERPPHSAMTRD